MSFIVKCYISVSDYLEKKVFVAVLIAISSEKIKKAFIAFCDETIHIITIICTGTSSRGLRMESNALPISRGGM